MSRIEQIKAEEKKLADELESEMLKERANVLAKIKEDIKLFAFLRILFLINRTSQLNTFYCLGKNSFNKKRGD